MAKVDVFVHDITGKTMILEASPPMYTATQYDGLPPENKQETTLTRASYERMLNFVTESDSWQPRLEYSYDKAASDDRHIVFLPDEGSTGES